MSGAERARRIENLNPAQRAALLQALESRAKDRGAAAAIPRSALPEPPLSFAQQRLWFLERLLPGAPAYHVAFAARLSGSLDVAAWRAALGRLIDRHAILRTRFPEDRPVQIALAELRAAVPEIDLARLAPAVRETESARIADCQVHLPFDLARPPLVRARLLRLTPEQHRQLLVLHHIVCDGWSDEILLRELVALYGAAVERKPDPLPPLPIQYSDYAAWQREQLTEALLERQLAFWRQHLEGVPPILDLPLDRPRPGVASQRAGRSAIAVPQVAPALRALGRALEATPFMLLLAAFEAFLARLSGRSDFAVGTPIANRNHRETQGLIGLFVNSLALRARLADDPTVHDVIVQVRRSTLDALAHGDLPFEQLVDALRPERTLSHAPIFQVLFLYLPDVGRPPRLGPTGLRVEASEIDSRSSPFDLSLSVAEVGDSIAGALVYARDLFEATTVERFAAQFAVLLRGLAADPERRLSDLPLLTSEERAQIAAWNATDRDLAGAETLHALVAAQSARTPDAPAVAFAGGELSYRELSARAGRLAGRLVQLGVRPGEIVALLLERSLDLLPALLGILEAGAAYLPLDPESPPQRLAFQLEDAGARVLLTASGSAEVPFSTLAVALPLTAEVFASGEPASVAVPPESLAYVLYTSGSTGQPKGAMVPHAGIRNRLLWMQRAYGLTVGDRVLQKTPLTFDVSLWELFWPLVAGACVVFARPGGHRDPAYLIDLIRAESIDTLHFVPSALQLVLEQPEASACRSLRRVVCSGEALPPELAARFFDRFGRGVALENLYGPTEASVDVTAWSCRPESTAIPIGHPIDNVRLHVLDRHGNQVPIGVAGELLLGGIALARGYLNRPDLTADRFVPDPFSRWPGERLYRTGDLTRRRPDGAIEFLGRIDHQVKIRGFRIELGEVEAALRAFPEVHEAVAAVAGDAGDDAARRLVCYLVPAPGAALDPEALRRALLERLPAYMVPAFFTVLEDLPRTPSGKVDRRRLPATDAASAALRQPYVPPSTATEQALAEIWAEVLRLDRIGIDDNFFALGGDSMNSVQVIARARERGISLTVSDVFRFPTLGELAAAAPAEVSALAAGDDALATLLAQVEGMTDEQAEALLGHRTGAAPRGLHARED